MSDRWYILGAGAIGHLLAWKLHRAGVDTCLVYRPGRLPEAPRNIRPTADATAEPIDCDRASADQLQPAQIEKLLLTTKANQACSALTDIQAALSNDALVVLAHNGMGVYEEVREHHPALNLALATTTEGAYWEDETTLLYAGAGTTRIGLMGQTNEAKWFATLAGAKTGFTWDEEIERTLWAKLMINCAINPLSAIHQCKNGELGTNPELRKQVKAVCEELAAVTRARGDNELADSIERQVFEVIEATAANYSSMMRDVRDGKESEIEYISGHFLGESTDLCINSPLCCAMLEQLHNRHHL